MLTPQQLIFLIQGAQNNGKISVAQAVLLESLCAYLLQQEREIRRLEREVNQLRKV